MRFHADYLIVITNASIIGQRPLEVHDTMIRSRVSNIGVTNFEHCYEQHRIWNSQWLKREFWLCCPCASQRSFMMSSQAKIRPCYYVASIMWISLAEDWSNREVENLSAQVLRKMSKNMWKLVPFAKVWEQQGTRPQPVRLWPEISVSFITGFPPSIKDEIECNAILTIIDRYSKTTIFLSVQDTINATEMAELFHSEMQCWFGPRFEIISGRDLMNRAKLWLQLPCGRCGQRPGRVPRKRPRPKTSRTPRNAPGSQCCFIAATGNRPGDRKFCDEATRNNERPKDPCDYRTTQTPRG